MKELNIPGWTGLCDVGGKIILGLGNDIYQIAVAIVAGSRPELRRSRSMRRTSTENASTALMESSTCSHRCVLESSFVRVASPRLRWPR